MILKKKIPKEFYKLFRTKNRDAYMQFLVAIYEENNEVYTALGADYIATGHYARIMQLPNALQAGRNAQSP